MTQTIDKLSQHCVEAYADKTPELLSHDLKTLLNDNTDEVEQTSKKKGKKRKCDLGETVADGSCVQVGVKSFGQKDACNPVLMKTAVAKMQPLHSSDLTSSPRRKKSKKEKNKGSKVNEEK